MWLNNPKVNPACSQESADLLSACALSLKIMEKAGVRVWDDLTELPFDLTPSQRACIHRHEGVVRYQRARLKLTDKTEDAPATYSSRVTINCCAECARWMLMTTDATKPSKCNLTVGCEGKLYGPALPSTSKNAPGEMFSEEEAQAEAERVRAGQEALAELEAAESELLAKIAEFDEINEAAESYSYGNASDLEAMTW